MGVDLRSARPLIVEVLSEFRDVIEKSDQFYHGFPLQIRDKAPRIIHPSVGPLKRAQKKINALLQHEVRWPPFVQGGVRGRSIQSNARLHLGKAMVASMDIKSFFPSIKHSMIVEALQIHGWNRIDATLLADGVTYQGELPQGAPTSTMIANLVFLQVDAELRKLCRKHDIEYSRYVDDLAMSSSKDFRSLKATLRSIIERKGFQLAEDKCHFMAKHQRQIVTKLVVNHTLRPTRSYLGDLKRDIRLCWEGRAGIQEVAIRRHITVGQLRSHFLGQLQFIKTVDRQLYQRIRALTVRIPWKGSPPPIEEPSSNSAR